MNTIILTQSAPDLCPECGKPENIIKICKYCKHEYKEDSEPWNFWEFCIFLATISIGMWILMAGFNLIDQCVGYTSCSISNALGSPLEFFNKLRW